MTKDRRPFFQNLHQYDEASIDPKKILFCQFLFFIILHLIFILFQNHYSNWIFKDPLQSIPYKKLQSRFIQTKGNLFVSQSQTFFYLSEISQMSRSTDDVLVYLILTLQIYRCCRNDNNRLIKLGANISWHNERFLSAMIQPACSCIVNI